MGRCLSLTYVQVEDIMEKGVMCAVMLKSAAGAELSSTAAAGQSSANPGLRQQTPTAVLTAGDYNLYITGPQQLVVPLATAVDPCLRRFGSVVASTAVDVCCHRPRLRSSELLLSTAAAHLGSSAPAAVTSMRTRLTPPPWCPLLMQTFILQGHPA